MQGSIYSDASKVRSVRSVVGS